NETAKSWHHHGRESLVQLFLSGAEGEAGELVNARVAGFPLALSLIAPEAAIDPSEISGAAAAVVQVAADSNASVARFKALAAASPTPLIAAAYDPSLSLVRALIRAGAHDVVPLPLDIAELEASLAPIRNKLAERVASGIASHSRLVSIIKSDGGIGATALLTQIATRFAASEAKCGREACLIDMDVQFGDAAFQLGLAPKLSLSDLVDAGSRLDGELLRATTTPHPSGLKILPAPRDMMPLEALSNELALSIVELAMREFGTVFIDLPTNWTNWSLSLLARSDLTLMVTEMSISSLHRARRQLNLIASQDLTNLDVRVIVNRFEKGMFKSVQPSDVADVLGQDIAFTVANDHATMSAAIDRGVPIEEIKRKSALSRDLSLIDAGVAAALGLER
ncbi:MAG TPA: pilus assembly protein CpaE, partial [Sphingomicrobium sp.]|nr:pilus assembly protein CpaE [Sphingomicrobium sp.]